VSSPLKLRKTSYLLRGADDEGRDVEAIEIKPAKEEPKKRSRNNVLSKKELKW
jgi:hypothetical protein